MPNYAMVLSDSLYTLYTIFVTAKADDRRTEQLLNLLQVPVLTNVATLLNKQ